MKRLFLSTLLIAAPLIGFAQNYQAAPPSNEQMIQPPPQAQTPMPAPAPAPQMQQAPMQQMQAPPPPPNVPVGDPNYYGQVDLVNNTQPAVIYSTPMVVQPAPPGVYYPPVYLRVPPMYYQNWPAYCSYYNACFYPVYFVQDSWYIGIYSPWYRRYYPYGRPGFVAHVYYGGHGGWHGDPHYDHGHHEEHRY